MDRKFTFEQIEELIQGLQGTCMSLDEGVSMYLGEDYSSNDLTSDDFEKIYGEIFLCDDCGLWFELVDESEDNPGDCNDCYYPE